MMQVHHSNHAQNHPTVDSNIIGCYCATSANDECTKKNNVQHHRKRKTSFTRNRNGFQKQVFFLLSKIQVKIVQHVNFLQVKPKKYDTLQSIRVFIIWFQFFWFSIRSILCRLKCETCRFLIFFIFDIPQWMLTSHILCAGLFFFILCYYILYVYCIYFRTNERHQWQNEIEIFSKRAHVIA